MSTPCQICLPVDCVFPADLDLYGLQGPQGPWTWFMVNFGNYPIDPVTHYVRVPVPGYGGYEWVNPGSIPTIYPSQASLINFRVLCCDGSYIVAHYPSTGTAAEQRALMLNVFNAIAQKQALCNRKAKIAATNKPKVFSPGRARAPFKLQPFPDTQTDQSGACIGIPFTKSIGATGAAIPPFQFSVTGGALPPGIVQSETQSGLALILSGRPTKIGNYSFMVQALDSNTPPAQDVGQYQISVMGVTNAPPNSNGEIPLPDGNIGYPYIEQLTVGGSVNPVAFAEDPDFPLPDWLGLSSSGLLTGTPPASAPYLFGVLLTDSIGTTCKSLILVNVYDVRFTNFGPPGGACCTAYSFQFTTSPTGCTFSGTCPPGLTVNAAGLVSGSPTSQGTHIFTITATDAHGRTATKTWSIVVTSALAYYTAVQDFTYLIQELNGGGGGSIVHNGSGGNLNWTGQIGPSGIGSQAIANDRVVGGFGVCSGPTYQVNFSLAYTLQTTTLTKNVRYSIRVSFGGVGNIIDTGQIFASQFVQSGVYNGTLGAGWVSPILQASILFEFDLFSDALPAGQSCSLKCQLQITPPIPP